MSQTETAQASTPATKAAADYSSLQRDFVDATISWLQAVANHGPAPQAAFSARV